MSPTAPAGSTTVTQVDNPAGGILYTVYTDPNGLTVNVPGVGGISVYADVNGNPIQYFDGQIYRSLQADYVASPDGTILYYVQPPSTYDQGRYTLSGDYDPLVAPGDQWRYYLVSGTSADLSSQPSFAGQGPFLVLSDFRGFAVADPDPETGLPAIPGYLLVRGAVPYPNLNTNSETFADLQVYKTLSLLDTFPIGDPATLVRFLKTRYP